MNAYQFGELLGTVVGLLFTSLLLTGIPAVIRILIKKPMTRRQAFITWLVALAFCITCLITMFFYEN